MANLNHITAKTLKSLIEILNEKAITKKDIVSIGKDGDMFYAVYKDYYNMTFDD